MILYVCTGNTCRSPMAAGITRTMAAKTRENMPICIESAGISADHGPYSAEASIALTNAGYPGVHGQAQPLTPALLSRATHVFAMTRGHLAAITRMDPGAVAKARLLDPAGHDVPDPVGGPQSLYDATARALEGMITARLKEIGP